MKEEPERKPSPRSLVSGSWSLKRKNMRLHHDLSVWQRAVDFVTRIYELTRTFPKEEMYGLTNQLRRAAVSIPSNIAEGAVSSPY